MIRMIDQEAAVTDIMNAGLQEVDLNTICDGGLDGTAVFSRVVWYRRWIWEFRKGHDGKTRVYKYEEMELWDHPFIADLSRGA